MPPFTEAEKAYLRAETDRHARTGYGINPHQDALVHTEADCRCHFCAGTEIVMTPHIPISAPYATHRPVRFLRRA